MTIAARPHRRSLAEVFRGQALEALAVVGHHTSPDSLLVDGTRRHRGQSAIDRTRLPMGTVDGVSWTARRERRAWLARSCVTLSEAPARRRTLANELAAAGRFEQHGNGVVVAKTEAGRYVRITAGGCLVALGYRRGSALDGARLWGHSFFCLWPEPTQARSHTTDPRFERAVRLWASRLTVPCRLGTNITALLRNRSEPHRLRRDRPGRRLSSIARSSLIHVTALAGGHKVF